MRMGINGKTYEMGRIDVEVALGSQEIWEIVSTEMAHPFHIHGATFQTRRKRGSRSRRTKLGSRTTVLDDSRAELLVSFRQPIDAREAFSLPLSHPRARRARDDGLLPFPTFCLRRHLMMHGYEMMGGFGVLHWLMFALVVAAIAYPVGIILKRLGYSPLWAALAFVPIFNIVGLWLVALSGREAYGPNS